MTDLSDEELRRIDGRWKSDVDRKSDIDLKLDKLVAFATKYESLLVLLTEREQRRKARWDAIIDKTLTGLIWAGIVFIGVAVLAYGKQVLGVEGGR